jgi:cell division protein FtsI/penicillin-binding protein 2
VTVCGKTGTAEVGPREKRRKNTWFIAYAPARMPTVAAAIVIEDGESGGATAAPRMAEILKEIFND